MESREVVTHRLTLTHQHALRKVRPSSQVRATPRRTPSAPAWPTGRTAAAAATGPGPAATPAAAGPRASRRAPCRPRPRRPPRTATRAGATASRRAPGAPAAFTERAEATVALKGRLKARRKCVNASGAPAYSETNVPFSVERGARTTSPTRRTAAGCRRTSSRAASACRRRARSAWTSASRALPRLPLLAPGALAQGRPGSFTQRHVALGLRVRGRGEQLMHEYPFLSCTTIRPGRFGLRPRRSRRQRRVRFPIESGLVLRFLAISWFLFATGQLHALSNRAIVVLGVQSNFIFPSATSRVVPES